MAIRNLRYEGDEILRKKSRDVEVIDEKILELIQDMFETMHKWDGVGLAAVQVGVLKRVIVIDLYDENKTQFALINPKVIKTEGEQECDEGCLSFPNKYGKVKRPEKAVVEGLNEKGKKIKIKAEGLLAEALLHEIDHLDGKLFVDMVEPGTLEIVTPKKEEK